MKIEVHCPDCQAGWLVEESSAGEMLCPACMSRIPLGRTAPATPKPPASPVASPPAEEIVCPRCNLHFNPRGHCAPETGSQSRRTVLVVDDLQYFRRIASEALHPTFEVKTAESRDETLALLAEGGVDLLVLDLTLGGGESGRELLSELNPKPCPILIFTAEDESDMYGDSWEELAKLGADDVVIKGMNVAESLVRKVSTLLGTPMDEESVIG